VLELPLDRIDEVGEHVVGVAVDRVVDILLRNAVTFGQALQDFAKLSLGLAPIGVELFPAARAGRAGSRKPAARRLGSVHHLALAVHAGAQLGQFL
jgi:hypothetical protein